MTNLTYWYIFAAKIAYSFPEELKYFDLLHCEIYDVYSDIRCMYNKMVDLAFRYAEDDYVEFVLVRDDVEKVYDLNVLAELYSY